jgi:hypothetical protein
MAAASGNIVFLVAVVAVVMGDLWSTYNSYTLILRVVGM